jgi:hypothetical protein
MRGDIPQAAFRLLTTLPCKRHEFNPPSKAIAEHQYRRRIRVGKRKFESVRDAIKTLKVSAKTIYVMLENGRAEYL